MKTTKKHDQKIILNVKARDIFGKKLKKLRQQGQVPANVFGQNFKSRAVAVDLKDFLKTFKVVKETGVIYLQLDKEDVPVLIQNLSYHPVNDLLLHVDFRKVDLTKKIQTDVPVITTGISEAVSQKGGVLLTQAHQLKVEARPEEIPSQIAVDISLLKEINQEIKVSDLPKSTAFAVIDPQEKVIVSVIAHKEEAVVPETTTVAPEIITEKEKELPAEEGKPAKMTPASAQNQPKSPPDKEAKK